jgi:hypothetical protein
MLAWLDDILGYTESEEALLEVLDKVLERCAAYGLKLHAKKCQFFATEVNWCGRIISAAGVKHCPERVQSLVEMHLPQTAGDLQQYLCAASWMRQSIPEYTRITSCLYDALGRAAKLVGSHKKTPLAKVCLEDVSWGDDEIAGFEDVGTALLVMVPLAHPSPTADVCLYIDASQDFSGAVVTQLEPEEVSLPSEEHHHRPLAFLSGQFVGVAARWPTIEKEAYAIVEATRILDYLLLRPKGFRLYTDHQNLVYIFDPYATDGTMARYQADKLQRWALSLLSFRYVIEHVPGEANAWGDLLSRWGAGQDQPADRAGVQIARLAVVERVSPLEESDFVWPTEAELKELQQHANDAGADLQGAEWSDERQLMVTPAGQVWIPADSAEMQQRLCVIAHVGASGHRGAKTTAHALSEMFSWTTLTKDFAVFVHGCLHCMTSVAVSLVRSERL